MKDHRFLAIGFLTHPTGNHVASWMHPDAQIDAGANFAHYVELAKIAERGNFDFMFLADVLAVRGGDLEALSRWQVGNLIEQGRLVRVVEDWCPYYPGFHLYYPSRRQSPATLRAFVDFARNTMK
jgi:DNA-binding transcriptional LysR family regulator